MQPFKLDGRGSFHMSDHRSVDRCCVETTRVLSRTQLVCELRQSPDPDVKDAVLPPTEDPRLPGQHRPRDATIIYKTSRSAVCRPPRQTRIPDSHNSEGRNQPQPSLRIAAATPDSAQVFRARSTKDNRRRPTQSPSSSSSAHRYGAPSFEGTNTGNKLA